MATVYQLFCGLMLVSILPGCNGKNESLTLSLKKSFVSTAVSSGSALAVEKDSILVIGDDAEYVAKLPINDTPFRRIDFYPNAPHVRMKRSIKHDLESCLTGNIDDEPYVFAFGSGGITPYRDTLFVISTMHPDKSFRKSLLPLYNLIRSKAGIKQTELNIEGAAMADGRLYLFNRGKNFVVSIQWDAFIRFVKDDNSSTVPGIRILNVSLPEINKFPVGFSGACTLNDRLLLFTASLEETTDFTKDGAIKGSYVGMLELTDANEINVKYFSRLQDEHGNDTNDKLESIEVIKTHGKNIEAVTVSDNDNGASKILYLDIVRP